MSVAPLVAQALGQVIVEATKLVVERRASERDIVEFLGRTAVDLASFRAEIGALNALNKQARKT